MCQQVAASESRALTGLLCHGIFSLIRSSRYRVGELEPRAELGLAYSVDSIRQRRIIRARSQEAKSMPKPKRDIGEEILTGIRELKRGESGRIRHLPPIAATRERMGLSQGQFARLLGVSVRTLQEWEQGRRAPSGAARTLILVASRNPKALLDVA